MKVTINEEGFIPGLGRGPFKNPMDLDSNQVFNLRQLGYLVLEVKEDHDRLKLDSSHLPGKQEQVEEEESEESEESVTEQETAEEPEEVVEEESTEEVEDAEQVDEDSTEEEEPLEELEEEIEKEYTVPELKELLDDAGIEYKYNARKDELMELVMENQDKL